MIKITDKKKCTGCHACLNICPSKCISMNSDKEGFWYPKVDMNNCKDCSLCEKVCPILNNKEIQNIPRAYACFNRDEIVRLDSSSGGIFSLIAELVLDNEGIVFGAKFSDNFSVEHSYIEKKEFLWKFRGSKYVQSKIGETYKLVKKFLKENKKVLFTGTPCQIGGLKAYLGKEYDNLFCIDIICHGVPSPKLWNKYILYMQELSRNPIKKVSFREKNEGWKRFSILFLFKNKKNYLKPFDKDLYMKAFLKNISLRPSCYDCNYKTLHRESDITLADFWGIEKILKDMDDDKGTSLIFVNNEKGNFLFNKIKKRIKYKEVDINKAIIYNQAAIKSVKKHNKREEFFKDLDIISFEKCIEKYCSDNFLNKALKLTKKQVNTMLEHLKHI